MKGTLGPNDYRESSTGFPFEIHKGCAGNGLELERLKWQSFWGTSGRLCTALQTRRAQLALKGCPGQTSGPGSAFFFGFDSPQALGCSLVPCFGGWEGEGGVFLFVFLQAELQRILTPKNQCCLINSGLVLSPAITADSQLKKKIRTVETRESPGQSAAAGVWAVLGGSATPMFLVIHAFSKYMSSTYSVPGDGNSKCKGPGVERAWSTREPA